MSTKVDVFVDQNEVEKASLYTSRLVSNGNFGSTYCVLTDKRVYHKGVFSSILSNGRFATGENVIEVKKISATSLTVRKHPILAILGFLFLLVAAAALVLNVMKVEWLPDDIAKIAIIGGIVLGILFFILYLAVQQKLFRIIYCGGELALQLNGVSVKSIRAFRTAVHAAISDSCCNKTKEPVIESSCSTTEATAPEAEMEAAPEAVAEAEVEAAPASEEANG